MSRPKPISGYPEFLPAGRIIEQRALDILRESFELHGFGSIETRVMEPLDVLSRKGEIDKEIFTVRRLHAEEGAADELGLHFDLTVPLARYVLENAGHLAYPFRRYQIQKVWRGERPQEGRYREFCQADIDIIGSETLAAHHDVEIPLVALEAFERLHTELGIPPVLMHVNNRKLSQGFYEGLGIEDTAAVLQRVDKFDKIGPDAVVDLLTGAARAERHGRPPVCGAGGHPVGGCVVRGSGPGAGRTLRSPRHRTRRAGHAGDHRGGRCAGPHRGRSEDRARARLLHGHGL